MTKEEAIRELEVIKKGYEALKEHDVRNGTFMCGELQGRWRVDTPQDNRYNRLINACSMAIDTLKTDWIPVEERLPEDEGEYLVTVRIEDDDFTNYGEKAVFTQFFKKADHLFHEPFFYDTDHAETHYEKYMVLAWMPLPEPYKEKGVSEWTI